VHNGPREALLLSDFWQRGAVTIGRTLYIYLSGGFAGRSHYAACAHSPRRVIAGILVAKINTARGKKRHVINPQAPELCPCGILLWLGARALSGPSAFIFYYMRAQSDGVIVRARLLTPVTDALTYANIIVRRLLFRGGARYYIPLFDVVCQTRARSCSSTPRALLIYAAWLPSAESKKNREFPGSRLRRLSTLCFIGKVDYAHLSCLTRFHAQNTT